ncbi:MAG: AbrB/MazE/SpoVT family DNA-binding domain-containing protein [Thermoprotei archaeon]|nr:AbrB/MazE/SpoVT family DNA-binding domain-containing protein [Thermoprotei archaeon]
MPVRRKIHAGQVYLGKEILNALGIKDGDEVELEVKEGKVVIRPVKVIDKDTLDLIRLLREVKTSGSREDYFEEYDYEDVGGWKN